MLFCDWIKRPKNPIRVFLYGYLYIAIFICFYCGSIEFSDGLRAEDLQKQIDGLGIVLTGIVLFCYLLLLKILTLSTRLKRLEDAE